MQRPVSKPAPEGAEDAPSRTTSYDVARLAGVSQSAVSRAYRQGASISSATRARVAAAAAELGYSPSLLARSLTSSRTGLVGLIVTDLTARNYPDLMHVLGTRIEATGSRMLVASMPFDADPAPAASDLLAFHVDGIVSTALLSEATLAASARRQVPVVLYNRDALADTAASVTCDHARAMERLTAHLVTGGLRRVAFIAGPPNAPVSDDRLRGLCAALGRRGLAAPCVRHADYSYDGGREAARALFQGGERPDTLVCANDAMALGALDALRHDVGLRVPEDVAVAGFDDVVQAAWPAYALTTLRQPLAAMTAAAVRLLAETAPPGPATRLRLDAALQVRGSTRVPLA